MPAKPSTYLMAGLIGTVITSGAAPRSVVGLAGGLTVPDTSMTTPTKHPALLLQSCAHCITGAMEYGFDEYGEYYTCTTCGRVTDLVSPVRRGEFDSKAGTLHLDYIGPYEAMKGIEVAFKVRHGRWKDQKEYYCPLPMESGPCGEAMERSKGDGRYRIKRTEGAQQQVNILGYRCPLRHEIRVVDGVGWF